MNYQYICMYIVSIISPLEGAHDFVSNISLLISEILTTVCIFLLMPMF